MKTMKRGELENAPFGGSDIGEEDSWAVVEETENGLWIWGSGPTPDQAYAVAQAYAEEAKADPWPRATVELVEIEEPLNTEIDTPEMGRRVQAAAEVILGRPAHEIQVDYEHGQWWVTILPTGAQYSVCDVEGDSEDIVDGFCLEQVSEGEEEEDPCADSNL